MPSLEGDGRSWATRARMERDKEHIANRRMCKDLPCVNYWKIIHEHGPPSITEDAHGTPLATPWSTDVTLYQRTGTLPMPYVIGQAGPQRLKAGAPEDWTVRHKTGTGQFYDGEQSGYNDIGLITSPAGRTYAIAVMIARTREPTPVRMEMMQEVVRAVVRYDEALPAVAPDAG